MTKTAQKLPPSAKSMSHPMCGFAVDHAALSSSVCLAGLGLIQLVAPSYVSDLTSLPTNTLGNGVAILWVAVGSLLAVSMATGNRANTNIAATMMFFVGLISFSVAMIGRPDIIHFLVHGAIVFLGFTSGEVASLAHKEQLKRAAIRAKGAVSRAKNKNHNGESHA